MKLMTPSEHTVTKLELAVRNEAALYQELLRAHAEYRETLNHLVYTDVVRKGAALPNWRIIHTVEDCADACRELAVHADEAALPDTPG